MKILTHILPERKKKELIKWYKELIFYIQQNIAANGAQRQQRSSSQPSSIPIV